MLEFYMIIARKNIYPELQGAHAPMPMTRPHHLNCHLSSRLVSDLTISNLAGAGPGRI